MDRKKMVFYLCITLVLYSLLPDLVLVVSSARIADGYLFLLVRVHADARLHGKIQAYHTENRIPLNELVLEPLREEYYYEKREPFPLQRLP
jgi:hypothetical protein